MKEKNKVTKWALTVWLYEGALSATLRTAGQVTAADSMKRTDLLTGCLLHLMAKWFIHLSAWRPHAVTVDWTSSTAQTAPGQWWILNCDMSTLWCTHLSASDHRASTVSACITVTLHTPGDRQSVQLRTQHTTAHIAGSLSRTGNKTVAVALTRHPRLSSTLSSSKNIKRKESSRERRCSTFKGKLINGLPKLLIESKSVLTDKKNKGGGGGGGGQLMILLQHRASWFCWQWYE